MVSLGSVKKQMLGTRRTSFLISLPSSKLTIFRILLTNMLLSTSLILAVCRTRVIYELRNVHLSLCSSVVEQRSAKSESLWFNSSWGLRIFFLCPTLVTRQKTSFSCVRFVSSKPLDEVFSSVTG